MVADALTIFKALQSPGCLGAAVALLQKSRINFGGVRWQDSIADYYCEKSRPDLFEHAAVAYRTVAISELEKMPSVRLRKGDVRKWRNALKKRDLLPSLVTTPLGYGFEGQRLILDGHHRSNAVQKVTDASHVRIAELIPDAGWEYLIENGNAHTRRTLVHIVPSGVAA